MPNVTPKMTETSMLLKDKWEKKSNDYLNKVSLALFSLANGRHLLFQWSNLMVM